MITRRLLRPASGLLASPSSTTAPPSLSQWTCPSCRPPSPRTPPQRRQLHQVPELAYHTYFTEKGIPGLLSKIGYKESWTKYQSHLVRKLNEHTAGQAYANKHPRDIALEFSRSSQHASLFNYASMAHNNDFFFKGLSTAPIRLADDPQLQASLENTFGSIDTLRAEFLQRANAMFGPGFVWLVWADLQNNIPAAGGNTGTAQAVQGNWRIMNTYLAGSPYAEAGYRHQPHSTSNTIAPTVGAFGSYSASGRGDAAIPPGGVKVTPVLCVNTWEHVWLVDFGIEGKSQFLKRWWDAVDWSVVSNYWPGRGKMAPRVRSEAYGRA